MPLGEARLELISGGCFISKLPEVCLHDVLASVVVLNALASERRLASAFSAWKQFSEPVGISFGGLIFQIF